MAQECPCGFEGENCDILDSSLSSVEDALNETCSPEGFEECFVSGQFGASCVCKCGYTGDFCEIRQEPQTYNQILAILIPFLLVLGSVYGIYRLNNPKDTSYPKLGSRFSDGGNLPSMALLVYRLAMAFIGIVIYLHNMITFGFDQMRFFTYWSWSLFTIYFFVSSYISLRHNFPATFKPREDIIGYDRIERVAHSLFTIEVNLAIMITALSWGYLYPTLNPTGQAGFLLTLRSYFVHGLNCLFLLIDFSFTNVHVVNAHVLYTYLVVGAYALFHGIYLLIRFWNGDTMCSMYSFFDQDTDIMVPFLLGLLVVVYIIHGLMILVSRAKYNCNGDESAQVASDTTENKDQDKQDLVV
eukprot:maker-scaffold_3-snap-gene-8.46-mRNA-1 protein AED:0.24 eAED:0.24 QI:16/1/1/1/1/1/2/112/355